MRTEDSWQAWSPVEEEWILQVPSRSGLAAQADRATRTSAGDCPFCPGGSEAVELDGRAVAHASLHPMIPPVSGFSRHFVTAYGLDHNKRLGDVTPRIADSFFSVIAKLTSELASHSTVKSVYAFESVGDHFGPTVAHPHGQVLGLPFVPRRISISGAICHLCEQPPARDLIVAEHAGCVLAVPLWSRLPFELIVYPTRHIPSLAYLSASEIIGLREMVQIGLRLGSSHFGGTPPYLLNVMQMPAEGGLHHLRVELVPLHKGGGELKRPGAMELGLGVYINHVDPESAATSLRARIWEMDQ